LALALVSRVRHQLPARIRGWPHGQNLAHAIRSGLPLLVRTIALRAVLLMTLWCANSSAANLAAYQITLSVWIFCCFALDAIAIAGQPFIGQGLGSGQRESVRQLTRQLIRWALFLGGILALILGVGHQVIPRAFSPDLLVREGVAQSLLVLALLLPWAGIVFVLDGVLIGAGDGLWLARAATLQLMGYLPLVAVLRPLAPTPAQIWLIFAVFMFLRGLMLIFRARGDAWLSSAQKMPMAAEVQP
jgi:Na+-driven multidrug efflux pump